MATVLGWMVVWTCLLTYPTTAQTKTKRQIYREQVLPLSGGKIPEEAFRADRLALNRLNKEGIAVPDGVLLEHRSVHSHPHVNKHDPEDEDSVIRIIQQSENRYVPEEGRYHNEMPLSIASTYLIRKPIGREETNIRTPDQQRPHHQALLHKQSNGYLPSYHYNPPRYHQQPPPQPQPQQYQHQPSRYPVRYHPSEQKPQVYHPIPVPFELPNKEIQEEKYYLKQYEGNNYPSAEEVSGRIDWPLYLDSFERLPSDLNNLLPHSGYDYESPSFQYYGSSESLPYYDEFSSFFGDRFVRKSAEGHAKGSDKRTFSKEPKKSRTFYRRVAQVKCSNKDSPNSSKCQVY